MRVKSKATFIAFVILILFFGTQCQKEFSVPEELIGVWVTDDPKYVDHPFEIKKGTLIFEQGLGYLDFAVFPIVNVEKSDTGVDTLYIIYYLIPAGRKFEFSFYYTPTEGGVIRFKNQPEMKWTKLKTASIEKTPHGQILEQTESKPGQPVVSQTDGKDEIEPAGQTTEGQPAVQKREVAHVQVSENRADTEIEAAQPQASSKKVSIEHFVEKWRRSWEEGDVETYIGCYHAGFTSRGMDIQAWKSHKQRLFSRSAKRNVQLSDMQIQTNGSSAVVTFTQSYQAAKHLDVGLKTLTLRRHKDRWTILKETWQPLSGRG